MFDSWQRNDINAPLSECVVVHGDPNPWNILVEETTNQADGSSSFGNNTKGLLYLCDWEVARAGCKGYDVGVVFLYAVEAILFLAATGQMEKAHATLDAMRYFWKVYADALVLDGAKDDKYLMEVFRSAMGLYGWAGYLFVYVMEAFIGKMPKDGLTDAEVKQVMGSAGLHHLKSLEMGFMDDVGAERMSLESLETFFFGFVEDEMHHLYNTIHLKDSMKQKGRESIVELEGNHVVPITSSI